jgi:tetratricopeptide (TPR) repeat protein
MASIPEPNKALKLFYSYAHKDERWRKRIETHLSMLQRQGYIASWHDRNITAGATWASEIDAYLTAADIILLLISPDFLASEYCYSVEMTRAMERHYAGKAHVIPIILRPTDSKGTPFERLQVLPSNAQPVSRWPDRDEALLDIATGIRKAIDGLNARAPGTQLFYGTRPTDTISAPLAAWNIPYHRNMFFTGRDDILAQLHATFTKSQPAPLIQVISGLGGIGKTQIAVEYAYRHQEEYEAILWARADSFEILVSDFVGIAELLYLPEKNAQDQKHIVNAVKHWLHFNPNWLLILDNAEDFAMIREFLPAVGGGHILLTTRTRLMGRLARYTEISKMKPEEGGLFLLRWAGIIGLDDLLDTAPMADRIKAIEISQVMDGLPLALDQAGAYIEETACSLTGYLKLYQKQNTVLLKRRGKLISDHPESVFTTWLPSFEKIQQANPAAAELLRFCAFLHPDAIPEEIIIEGAPELGPVLHSVAENPFELNDAIGELLKFSLVQRDSASNTIAIHRLLQTVVRGGMDEATHRLWAERAVRAVNRALPDFELIALHEYQRYLPHAQACITLMEQLHVAFTEAAQLLYQVGHYYLKRAQYDRAEPLYQLALAIYEEELGPDHPHVATSIDGLASLYRKQGKYDQAKLLYQLALTRAEKASSHSSVATSLNNLAELCRVQGNFEQAELLYKRALAHLEQTLGSEHPYVATILENLTILYCDQGNYKQAEPLYQRTLLLYKQTLELDYPGTTTSLGNYVDLLQNLSRDEDRVFAED